MRRISLEDHGKILREQIVHPPAGELPLHAFMRLCWRLVENRPFKDGWHLHAEAEALTAMHNGDLLQLILNITPGSCKSLFCNVFWPAFIWLEVDPCRAMAFVSYSDQLVNRDAKRFVDLLNHPLIRTAYPKHYIDPNQGIGSFFNSEKGERFGTTPGSEFTGRHYDQHVYDDLIKPASIIAGVAGEHQKALSKAVEWINTTASSRAKDVEKLARLLIGQRLHELDPSGVLLETGDWEHLCLPERYDPGAKYIFGGLSAKLDRRTKPGQLLWPEHRSEKAVAILEKRLGSPANVAAQMQQNPSPATGGIVNQTMVHRYRYAPRLLDCRIIASLDLAFGTKSGNTAERSRCAWQLWAEHKDLYYMLDAGAQHMSYAQAKAKVKELKASELWGQAQSWIVEDKANGPALMSDLSEMGMMPFEPSGGSKGERMLPYVELWHGGKVLIPEDVIAPWAAEVLDEICKFPRAAHDDHFDCASQALGYLKYKLLNYRQIASLWGAT